MIRRPLDPHRWLLISQVAHARLSGEIARSWSVEGRWRLLWPLVVEATAHHDDGWEQWEQHPQPDRETGVPRSFTEMPMHVSAQIWARSVHAAGEAAAEATAESRHRSTSGTTGGEEAFAKPSSSALADAWRRGHAALLDADVAAALGATWVSRHFCWLAEQALRHRQSTRERAAAEEFLRSQHKLQSQWGCVLAGGLGGAGAAERLSEEGFRWVQLFDRISLWLCLEPPEAPEAEFVDPWDRRYVARIERESVDPEAAEGRHRRINWRPFPFERGDVVCELTGRAVPQRPYEDAAQLAEELRRGEPITLRWEMLRR